ncbi:MAG: c-type cytochrome [Gallionella sp.]|nr:c-type cytochrome [Gallionella sp.]
MRNIQWMTSVLMAGIFYAGSASAADTVVDAVATPVSAIAATPETKEAALSDADGIALLKKNNCLTCHAMDKKVLGPGFKNVAAKYREQADAEAKLITKVSKGSKGVWGNMAMPAQSAKPDDIKSMVKFILSQK